MKKGFDYHQLEDKLWAGFTKPYNSTMCWLWVRANNGRGYGKMSWNGRMQYTHRLAYLLYVGPIPPGLVLDHLCRVTSCCNPDHLEAVTHVENMRRGLVGAQQTAKTHCPRNHPYDHENTYITPSGSRDCKICISRRGHECWIRRKARV